MKTKLVLIGILFSVLSVVLIWLHSGLNDDLFRVASLIGTLASLCGLVIIWFQSQAIESVAKASKKASMDTKDRIVSLLSIVDVTKMTKTVQEIQGYNRSAKFELSVIRMQELREGLQQIKNNSQFSDYISQPWYFRVVTDLSVDVHSIEKALSKKVDEIYTTVLNRNLEKILTELSELAAKIKYTGA